MNTPVIVKNLISLLHTATMMTYLYTGLYIYYKDKKSPVNRNFLLTCLCFALWSGSYAFLTFSPDRYIPLLERIGHCGANLYYYFALRFILHLTGFYSKIKRPCLFNLLSPIIPLSLTVYNLISNFMVIQYPDGFLVLFAHIFANAVNFLSITLAISWGWKSGVYKYRMQAIWISFGAFLSIILTLVSDFTLGYSGLRTLTPSIIVIWIFCIFHAMLKYRFVSLTSALLSEGAVNNMDHSVIILNLEGKRAWGNGPSEILGESFLNEIEDRDQIFDSLNELKKGAFSDFSCHLKGKKRDGEKVFFEAKFSLIRDDFNDVVGILFVGREIKELNDLKGQFKITGKELSVIQLVFDGLSNREIARQMDITERTVKSHLTNIFNKLGIDSRTQLMNLLIDYNVIPRLPADKRLVRF